MDHAMNFTGKRILISGASSGIGAETAVFLSQLGATVYLVARREEKLRETLSRMTGSDHQYYVFDLAELEKIEALINRIVLENGPLDGFVHSAGIGPARPLKMTTYTFMQEVMNVNHFSFIEQLRCLTKKSFYRAPFAVVGVSSVASVRGTKAQTAYASSKGAMDAAVRVLAKELAGKGVRINTVLPGLIDTALGSDYLTRGANENKLKEVLTRQVLGMGYPLDVAHAIAFLLSDLSSFMTGTAIHVDGGVLA